jgi:sulfur-oxidizing protein SoxB
MGQRISAMRLRGKLLEPGRKYRVAGWAPVSDEARAAGGEPVWELMARYLRAQRTIAPRAVNVPKLEGVAGNPGIA